MTESFKFQPPVIAHRGASAYAPENTLSAFIKAAQLGIKWVEFDVMQSASGEPVIFHDSKLHRTTNGRGELNKYSYAYLQTLDAGSWFHPTFSGERIPTFVQVLKFLQDMKMSANVEIKARPGNEDKLIVKMLEDMSQHLTTSRSQILFSSFSIDALRKLRKHAPDCNIGLLMHEWLSDWNEICKSLRCISVHVNNAILTQERAYQIKADGKLLLCYTVNDLARAEELYSWGVDAVFSDVPDKIARLSS